MLNRSDVFTMQALAFLAGAYCLYGLALAIYRVYLSPLSKFPGPKLAAATFWYEFYYDVWLGGQYIFQIGRLHQKYGPVIRINPHEIHVRTPEFYDVLYSGPARRRHKWNWAMRGFGADRSTFGTAAHDVHRMRKAAVNQFFSMGQVRQLESVIQEVVDTFIRRVDGFRADGQVFRVDTACNALTADLITEYAFGKSSRLIEVPDFDVAFQESMVDGARQFFLSRQFPNLLRLGRKVPGSLVLKLNPSLTSFANMQRSIGAQVAQILNRPPNQRHMTEPARKRTIFVELLDSKLPPEEKTFIRLAEEGGILIGAGTLTTAWTITVAIFYLLRNPSCLAKLKQELSTALAADTPEATEKSPSPKSLLLTLENLPYFNAIIQETLRHSYGVATRLTRLAPDEELVVPTDGSSPGSREWRIPRNTPVSMTQLDMLQHEAVFPSPKQFRPERWIEDPSLARFQVAFGKGSRQCLGKNLALAEIHLLLAALFGRYGSREVRMEGDVGYLELFETDESDIVCSVDGFMPLPKRDSKGVRVRVHSW